MKPICQVVLFCLLCGTQTFAQKLPDVQKEGLRAPADLKIDGQLTEWAAMAAYNKVVVLYYTIANDDENLYLAVKSDNTLITSKILAGGFALSINTTAKKQKEAITVTYPFIEDDDMNRAMMNFAIKGLNNGDAKMAPDQEQDITAKRKAGRAVINRQILNLFKFIKLKGIKQIADKQIPIYNELGIKVAAKIDSQGDYICEMAVPLKYLNLPNNTAAINYNIKLLAKYWPSGIPRGGVTVTHNGGPPLGEGGVDSRSMSVDTDFWAEYVLKK